MAAHDQRTAASGLVQVIDGQRLRGHRTDHAHIEVLLPADQRLVGAAEGDIERLAAQIDGHGRKLGLTGRVDFVGEGDQPRVLKPRAFSQYLQKAHVVGQQHGAADVGQSEQQPGRFAQTQRRVNLSKVDALEGQIGDAGEYGAVYLVERVIPKRQVAAPEQIIDHVCGHMEPPG